MRLDYLYIQVYTSRIISTLTLNDLIFMAKPRYEYIKSELLNAIEQGALLPGAQVPSENQLAEQYSVSRMTARRALEELSDAGFLMRSQGLGTFVADARPMSSMLEIRNIADDIRDRGHECDVKVLTLAAVTASEKHAQWLGLKQPTDVFHSVIVYFENGLAVQYEDRYINPELVPDYLQQNFQLTTPNEYLSQVAPLTEADHIVEAVIANDTIASELNISATQPCLKVTRRTFSGAGIVSVAELFHPGDRYRLGGHIQVQPK